jgi:hypothetical protein
VFITDPIDLPMISPLPAIGSLKKLINLAEELLRNARLKRLLKDSASVIGGADSNKRLIGKQIVPFSERLNSLIQLVSGATSIWVMDEPGRDSMEIDFIPDKNCSPGSVILSYCSDKFKSIFVCERFL